MVLSIMALSIRYEVKIMAIKNVLLDDKIIKSARKEFLEHGYRNASLHKIAANAGITTGALYTRYNGKDDLFRSLVKNLLNQIDESSQTIAHQYQEVQLGKSAEEIIGVIRSEMNAYNALMVENYEECFLFYCRSEGSSVEKQLKEMLYSKTEQTIAYLSTIAKPGVDLTGIKLVMELQFYLFRQMLEYNYQNHLSSSSMELVDIFEQAGWRAIFENILKVE